MPSPKHPPYQDQMTRNHHFRSVCSSVCLSIHLYTHLCNFWSIQSTAFIFGIYLTHLSGHVLQMTSLLTEILIILIDPLSWDGHALWHAFHHHTLFFICLISVHVQVLWHLSSAHQQMLWRPELWINQ